MISLAHILDDIADRMGTFAEAQGIDERLLRRIVGSRRQLYAVEEAIKWFVNTAPAMQLSGYENVVTPAADPISQALRLKSYAWPVTAAKGRTDGGLLHIIIDGTEFSHVPIWEPALIHADIKSLQIQQKAILLYGENAQNYAVDLIAGRIFTLGNSVLQLRIIEKPEAWDYGPEGTDASNVPADFPISPDFLEVISQKALAFMSALVLGPNAGQAQAQAQKQGEEAAG